MSIASLRGLDGVGPVDGVEGGEVANVEGPVSVTSTHTHTHTQIRASSQNTKHGEEGKGRGEGREGKK